MKTAQYLILSVLLLASACLGGIVGSSLFSATGAFAQDDTVSLAASLFEVVDQNGIPRIQLGIDDDGQPAMILFDENNQRREVLSITSEGEPIFVMSDNENRPRLIMGVVVDEGPQIGLYSEDQETIWVKP